MASGEKIVPRWEWRCFAPSLEGLAQRAGLPPGAPAHESDEVYILALDRAVADNIKIRGGVLDVKRLRQTNQDGLEQWEPIVKASFPVRRQEIAALFPGLAPAKEAYSVAELVEFAAARPALRAIAVHKSRRGFSFGGCIAELARITGEGLALDSFSLEHEDPGRVATALGALRLDGRANTSYPVGLARALGPARRPA